MEQAQIKAQSCFPKLDSQVGLKAQNARVEGVQGLQYSNILPTSFLWFLVGKPGSGKSTLIKQLLTNKQLYYRKFQDVLFVSPSDFGTDFPIHEQSKSQEFSVDWLFSQITSIQQQQRDTQTCIKNRNVLVIIDDFIAAISKSIANPIVSQLFFNRRHIIPDATISIIVTAQKYTGIPARIRSIGDAFSFFSLNQKDWQLVKEELIFFDDIKLCQQVIQKIFSQNAHDFVYIRTQPFIVGQSFRPLIYEGQFHPFADDTGKEVSQTTTQQHTQQSLIDYTSTQHHRSQKQKSFFS